MKTSIAFTEALEILRSSVHILTDETVPLEDACGRTLAEDLIAPADVPGFSNASMDGFAIRLQPGGARGEYTVVGEAPAGQPFTDELKPGQAVRIMTGGVVPPSADAVIEVEQVEETGPVIKVAASVQPGRNVRKAGEDLRSGETVMRRGTLLRAFHIGVAAAAGRASLKVVRKPAVNVVSTGSELVPPGRPLQTGQVHNSTAAMLPALIAEAGCTVRSVRTATDDVADLNAVLAGAFNSDVLITTGGISAGKYDLVLRILKELGVRLLFWKVTMKPGMPFAFGLTPANAPVFCLPGNPVSTAVTFLKLVRPALLAMQGAAGGEPIRLEALTEHPIRKQDGKRYFVRGLLDERGGALRVRTTGSQSSGVLSSMVKANCLIILGEADRDIPAGARVNVELL